MMNDRIRKLAKQADKWAAEEFHQLFLDNINADRQELFNKKFAELIVKECIYTLQLKIVRNGNTPENLRSREHIRDLGEKFGIEFPMDYYPDRNKHFGVES
jgi:hypothetical protein